MSVTPLPSRQSDVVTEDSAALQFAYRHADYLRFDHSVGAWYRFDGASWRRDGTRLALGWARNIARELSAGVREDKTRAVIGRAGFAKGVETLARVDQRIAITSDAWDRDNFLLGTPGGTVDVRENCANRTPRTSSRSQPASGQLQPPIARYGIVSLMTPRATHLLSRSFSAGPDIVSLATSVNMPSLSSLAMVETEKACF